MNNNNAFRKTLIILLIIVTMVVVAFALYRGVNKPTEPAESLTEEQIEIKNTTELIAEQKFALIELNDEGFSEKSVEVPFGGVLEIRNNTNREVTLDIRAENYVAGFIVKAGETGYSPVFTVAGEYTLSEFVDGEINEEISTKIIVN